MNQNTVQVDSTGALRALAAAQGALVAGDAQLAQEAQLFRRAVIARINKGITAAGDLARGIVTSKLAIAVYQIAATARHSSWVEKGTGVYGPSRQPYSKMLPPSGVAAIAAWIKRKGIVARSVPQRSLPWVIARKIAQTGTKAQPFMEPVRVERQIGIRERVRAAILKQIGATQVA